MQKQLKELNNVPQIRGNKEKEVHYPFGKYCNLKTTFGLMAFVVFRDSGTLHCFKFVQ